MAKKIIVVGRQDSVVRVVYDTTAKTAQAFDFDGVVSGAVQGSTRINNLAVIVRTMQQLAEKDLSKETEPITFLTVGMVSDMIANGTFKYWLLGNGKKNDGTPVDENEMSLWKLFAEIYPQMYTHVTFKDVATVRVPKNPKFQVSQETRIEAEYITKAWDRVKVTAPELVDGVEEAI